MWRWVALTKYHTHLCRPNDYNGHEKEGVNMVKSRLYPLCNVSIECWHTLHGSNSCVSIHAGSRPTFRRLVSPKPCCVTMQWHKIKQKSSPDIVSVRSSWWERMQPSIPVSLQMNAVKSLTREPLVEVQICMESVGWKDYTEPSSATSFNLLSNTTN